MKIYYTASFSRGYKKLPKEIKLLAEMKEKIFREDPFARPLDTHKLHGRLKEFWSFSIDSSHRVIFEFNAKNEVVFHSIGNHKIYD